MSCGNLSTAQCCTDMQALTPSLVNQCLSQESRWAVVKKVADKLIDVACVDALAVPKCAAYVGTASSGFYALWLANNVGGFITRPSCSDCHELVVYNTQNSRVATFRNCIDDGDGQYTLSALDPSVDANWVQTGATERSWDAQVWGWEARYVRTGQTQESYSSGVSNNMRFDNPVIRDSGLTGLFTFDGTAGSIILPVGSYQLLSTFSAFVDITPSGFTENQLYSKGWHDFYTSTSIYLKQGSGTTPTQYEFGRHHSLFYMETDILEFAVTGTPMTIYPRVLFNTYRDTNDDVNGTGTLRISGKHAEGSIKINKVG